MKRGYFLVFLVIGVLGSSSLSAGVVSDAINQYQAGNYREAAEILDEVEEKGAREYYYAGLFYYKAGNVRKARNNFMKSYVLSPESRWGKASYKNFSALIEKKMFFSFSSDLLYDSNVAYIPDAQLKEDDGFYMDLGFTWLYNIKPQFSLYYSYRREQYFADFDNYDTHRLKATFYKGPHEIYVSPAVSMIDFSMFSGSFSTGFEGSFCSLAGTFSDYDQEYGYLKGSLMEASLFKDFANARLSYNFSMKKAEDREGNFTYQKAKISGEGDDLEFENVESDKEYFTSYSYSQHGIEISGFARLKEKLTLNLFVEAAYREYLDSDVWYKSTWLEDTDGNKWYYWSGESDEWVEDSSPPGEKISEKRRDVRIRGGFTVRRKLGRSTEINIKALYKTNISSIEAAENDYNWRGITAGAGINYRF